MVRNGARMDELLPLSATDFLPRGLGRDGTMEALGIWAVSLLVAAVDDQTGRPIAVQLPIARLVVVRTRFPTFSILLGNGFLDGLANIITVGPRSPAVRFYPRTGRTRCRCWMRHGFCRQTGAVP